MRRPLPASQTPLRALCASLLVTPALADRALPDPSLPPTLHSTIPSALRPPLSIAPAEPVRDAYSAWAHRLDLSHIQTEPAENRRPARVLATNVPALPTPSLPAARALLDRIDDAWLLADEGLRTSRWVLEKLHSHAGRVIATRAARLADAAGSIARAPFHTVPIHASLASTPHAPRPLVRTPLIAALPPIILRAADLHGFHLPKPHADLAWAEVRQRPAPIRPAPTFTFLGMGPHGTLDAPTHEDAIAAE